MQQVHGSAAQPQAVDAVGGLFEVGHHATGGHCSTQLRPVVRSPPVLQPDWTGARSKKLRAGAHTHTHTRAHTGEMLEVCAKKVMTNSPEFKSCFIFRVEVGQINADIFLPTRIP